SQKLASAGGVGHEPLHLAGGRPHALVVVDDASRAAGDPDDHFGDLADRDLAAAAEMNRLAFNARDRRGAHEGLDGIVDIDEIPGWTGGAETDRVPGQGLQRDRRNDGARALTRAKGVEGP